MDNILTQENINMIFTVFLIPLLGVIVTYITSFIKKKTEELKVKIDNEETTKYLELAENAIITAVTSVTQTYVSSLKNNGKFTKEAQIEAFNMAKESALAIMSDTTKEMVALAVSDFDVWVNITIEAVVSENK